MLHCLGCGLWKSNINECDKVAISNEFIWCLRLLKKVCKKFSWCESWLAGFNCYETTYLYIYKLVKYFSVYNFWIVQTDIPPIRRATRRGGWERPPLPFLKIKKSVLILEKKCPDCIHPWVKLTIQKVVLWVSRIKNSKISLLGFLFLNFWRNVYRSALILRNLPCPEKFPVARLPI